MQGHSLLSMNSTSASSSSKSSIFSYLHQQHAHWVWQPRLEAQERVWGLLQLTAGASKMSTQQATAAELDGQPPCSCTVCTLAWGSLESWMAVQATMQVEAGASTGLLSRCLTELDMSARYCADSSA